MDPEADGALDGLLHHLVLDSVARSGAALRVPELARRVGVSDGEVRRGLERLDAGHGLVLHPGTHDVWLAHPFALVPTAFFVRTEARGHWAPCIWCALGVVALTGRPATIHTHLAGEHEPVVIEAGVDGVVPEGLVAHFPVPVAQAWDNVHRFCGSTLVFGGEAQVASWCERHGVERGDVLSLERVHALACSWYGGHLARDWRKWTVDEARAIFKGCGLSGPTWDLPDARGRF